MDLTEFTRWVIVVGYYATAIWGAFSFRRARLINYKLAATAAVVIGVLWGTFYLILNFLAPLDDGELLMATYLSRVNHLPVIAAMGVMLYSFRQTEGAVKRVAEEVASRGVS